MAGSPLNRPAKSNPHNQLGKSVMAHSNWVQISPALTSTTRTFSRDLHQRASLRCALRQCLRKHLQCCRKLPGGPDFSGADLTGAKGLRTGSLRKSASLCSPPLLAANGNGVRNGVILMPGPLPNRCDPVRIKASGTAIRPHRARTARSALASDDQPGRASRCIRRLFAHVAATGPSH